MAGVHDTLASRYELLEVVGRGGMGVVYRARDTRLGRTVAVKVLAGHHGDDPVQAARFQREAQAAAALNHPNIVSVYDTGTDADGSRFIVLEYVDGRSLAELVRAQGTLAPATATGYAAQVAEALAAAHAAGIVHRDIKPANVMVDRTGTVKVLDFGIARLEDSTTLTGNSSVIGSAPYLSPEAIRGEPADARADIYALGCLLYELLTGAPPFRGEGAVPVMHHHLSTEPQPPSVRSAAVPAALDALVLQMLAKRPEQRPASASVLASDLRRALDPADAGSTATRTAAARTAATRMIAAEPTAATRALRDRTAATRALRDRTAATRVLAGRPATSGAIPAVLRDSRRAAVLAALLVAVLVAGALAAILSSGGGPAKPSSQAAKSTRHRTGTRTVASTTRTASSTTAPAADTATADTGRDTTRAAPAAPAPAPGPAPAPAHPGHGHGPKGKGPGHPHGGGHGHG